MNHPHRRLRAPYVLKLALLSATILAGPAFAAEDQTTSVEELVVTGSRVSEASVAIGTDKVTATVSITSEALLSARPASPA